MAFRKQQLCHRTSDKIRSCIRKTVTTYSRVKPTEVLPVNSEVHPLVNLASGPTGLLASMDGSLLDQLLRLAASAHCSTRERTPMPTA